MLICAYLMGNKEETSRRLHEVEQLRDELGDNSQFSILNSQLEENSQLKADAEEEFSTFNSQFSTELSCYLVTALFIVTHNPEYRKAAKVWRQNHPDCSLAIRRFLSIAKQIRC